jgi:hypothetical protein
MQNQLFEAALGIAKPWYVRGVGFDAARKVLTIGIDFVAGSCENEKEKWDDPSKGRADGILASGLWPACLGKRLLYIALVTLAGVAG